MVRIYIYCLVALCSWNYVKANAILQVCEGQVYVDNEIILDVANQEECTLEIQTQQNRILVFTVIDGNFQDAQNFIAIHDGPNKDSPILFAKNQSGFLSRRNATDAIYTSTPEAILRFKKRPTKHFQLKIQKAVNCPFNLGSESQCGRILDDVSCYCAVFTKRKQQDQKAYCASHAMSILSLENVEEEKAIHVAWYTSAYFWTSLTDDKNEGDWVWETTNANLYPGYSNWCSKQPDNAGVLGGEDCMHINYESTGCWNDKDCGENLDAICEAHP